MSIKTHIALVDCNNFFVSCERLFRPDLEESPVLILSSNDGCVISRSEEVKALGIQMAAPYFTVREVCKENNVTVFSSNFALYRDISRRVMHVLRSYAEVVEVYSVDEAFLSVDRKLHNMEVFAESVRLAVFRNVGVPVSVGVAETKTLAKVATHFAKPKRKGKGTKVLLSPTSVVDARKHIPVGEVWGIGLQTKRLLHRHGIHTVQDFVLMDNAWIQRKTRICGLRTALELQGTQCFTVGGHTEHRKSLFHSQSFGSFRHTKQSLTTPVTYHARKVSETLRAEGVVAKEVGVFLRTARNEKKPHTILEHELLPQHTNDTLSLVQATSRLLNHMYRSNTSYVKAGVLVRNIIPEEAQPSKTLFGAVVEERKTLMKALDTIRHRFGDVVQLAAESGDGAWRSKHASLSPRYTTNWTDIAHVPEPQ